MIATLFGLPSVGICFVVGVALFLWALIGSLDPLGRGRTDWLLFTGLGLVALSLIGAVVHGVLWLFGGAA